MVLPGLQLGVFETIKTTILSGFYALPFLLIIITGFLGTITSNVGLLILFVGQVLVVPLLQNLLFFVRNTKTFSDIARLGAVPKLDPLCSLVPDKSAKGSFSSPITTYWMAEICFFFGFILANAYTVYILEPEKGASPGPVENRKAQAMISMLISLAVFVGLLALYKTISKCETTGSFITALVVFITAGIVWFAFDVQCGIKQADIFGVASKIHTIGPDEGQYPSVCVPVKNETCKKA